MLNVKIRDGEQQYKLNRQSVAHHTDMGLESVWAVVYKIQIPI